MLLFFQNAVAAANVGPPAVTPPQPPYPPIANLTDDFQDTVRDTAKWDLGNLANASLTPTLGTLSETGNVLRVALPTTTNTSGTHYHGYTAKEAWLLNGSEVYQRMQFSVSSTTNIEGFLAIGHPTGRRYIFTVFNGGIRLMHTGITSGAHNNDYTTVGPTNTAYDPIAHRWLKLSTDATRIYAHTAPDNASGTGPGTWALFTDQPKLADLEDGAIKAGPGGGTFGAASAANIDFDGFNTNTVSLVIVNIAGSASGVGNGLASGVGIQAAAGVTSGATGTGLGPQLISNGTFDTDIAGWSAGDGVSWESGRLRAANSATVGFAQSESSFSTEVGKVYTVSADIEVFGGSNARVIFYSNSYEYLGEASTPNATSGTFSVSGTFQATTATSRILLLNNSSNSGAGASSYSLFDNVSARRGFGSGATGQAISIVEAVGTARGGSYSEPELLTNPNFDTNVTGWSVDAGGTIEWDNGRLKLTRTSGTADLFAYQDVPVTAGKLYHALVRVVAQSSFLTNVVGLGNNLDGSSGTGTIEHKSGAAGNTVRFKFGFLAGSGSVGSWATFDVASLKQEAVTATGAAVTIVSAVGTAIGGTRGPHLTTNSSFQTNTAGWTANANATLSWQDGRVRITRSGSLTGDAYAVQSISGLIEGRAYIATARWVNKTVNGSQNAEIFISTEGGNAGSGASGSFSYKFNSVATAAEIRVGLAGSANGMAGDYVEFDDVEVHLDTTAATGQAVTIVEAIGSASGYARRANLVANGNFETDLTGWVAASERATISRVSNRLRVTRAVASDTALADYALSGLKVGTTYDVVVPFHNKTTNGNQTVQARVRTAAQNVGSGGTSGTLFITFAAISTTETLAVGLSSDAGGTVGDYVDFDDISFTERGVTAAGASFTQAVGAASGASDRKQSIVENGSFDSNVSGWTAVNCDLSWVDGRIRVTRNATDPTDQCYAEQSLVGKARFILYSVKSSFLNKSSASSARFNFSGFIQTQDTASGLFDFFSFGPSVENAALIRVGLSANASGLAGDYIDFDDISVIPNAGTVAAAQSIAASVGHAAGSSTNGVNLLTNGDFTTDYSGWGILGSPILAWEAGGVRITRNPANENQQVGLTQSVAVTVGKKYRLLPHFSQAHPDETVLVGLVGGTALQTTPAGLLEFGYEFVATSSPVTVRVGLATGGSVGRYAILDRITMFEEGVTAQAASLADGVGSSANVGTATGSGAQLAVALGTAAGVGTPLATGSSTTIAEAVGTAAGSCAVTAVGAVADQVTAAVGTTSGAGAAAGALMVIAEAVGSASGLGTVAATSSAVVEGVGMAAGAGAATAQGNQLAVAVGAAVGSTGGATELITNGTFDSNINGWTAVSANPATLAWVAGAMRVTRGSADDFALAINTVTGLTVGKKYIVSARYFDYQGSTGAYADVTDGGSGANSHNYQTSGVLALAFTALSTSVTVRVGMKNTTNLSDTMLIDDVSLRQDISATGVSVREAAGAASGIAAAVATSEADAVVTAVGTSAGVATAAADPVAIHQAIAAASGTGTPAAIATATAASVGASQGLGDATGEGITATIATGSASGVGTAASTASSSASAAGAASGVGAGYAESYQITILSAVGSAAGVGTADASGQVTSAGQGASAGLASVAAQGRTIAEDAAETNGSSTATAVGVAISPAVGAAMGFSTVAAQTRATAESTGAALGTGSALSTGVGLRDAAGDSAGTSSVVGAGFALASAVGSSTSTATASGAGDSVLTVEASGAAAGASTSTSESIARSLAAGSADGVGTALGDGARTAAAEGTATGSSTAAAPGVMIDEAIGAASGTSVTSGTSTATASSVGTSAGSTQVSGSSNSTATMTSVGTSVGAGAADSVGLTINEGAGEASGVGSVAAAGGSVSSGEGAATGLSYGASAGVAMIETVGASSGVTESVASSQSTASAAGAASGVADAYALGADAVLIRSAAGSASGATTAVSSALAVARGVGATNGTSSGTSSAQKIASSTGIATGLGDADAVGVRIAEAAGSASGAGTAVSVVRGIVSATGNASGAGATEAGTGVVYIATAVGSSSGAGVGTSPASAFRTGVGMSSGFGIVVGGFSAIADATGLSAGAADATGQARRGNPGPRRGETGEERLEFTGQGARTGSSGGGSRIGSATGGRIGRAGGGRRAA